MPKKTSGGGIFIIAVILSLACAYGFWLFMRDIQAGYQENWQPVVVAVTDISPKTKITEEMIELRPIPKNLIAEGVSFDTNEVVGKFVRDRVRSKEQVRLNDLFMEGDPGALDLVIPRGMRAVSIGADEVKAVGASVKPGNYVDVAATYTDPAAKEQVTQFILQKAKVVWVNQGQTNPNMEGGAITSMTLLVKPEEAELLTAAERAGVIRVALRSAHDDEILERQIPPSWVRFEKSSTVAASADPTATNMAVEIKTPVYISPPTRGGMKVYRGVVQEYVQP